MAHIFATAARPTNAQSPATTLRIQTSVAGLPRPLIWGENRIAPNLLYFNDFTAVEIQQAPQGGGKGTGGGNSGKGGGGATQTKYSCTVICGLCEGPIVDVPIIFQSKSITTPGALNFGLELGNYSQTAWPFLLSAHPADARDRRGTAYLCAAPFDLGSSPEMPALTAVVTTGPSTSGLALAPDWNPGDWMIDFLTNPFYGLGFPSSRIGDTGLLTLIQYTLAVSISASPVLVTQVAANSILQDMMTACVAEAVWSAGKIKVVPYYEFPVTANGVTYTPNITPIYDLTDDDFLPGSNNSYQAPVIMKRKPANQVFNSVKITYLSRANNYNPAVAEAKDDGSIQQFEVRRKDPQQLDFFCDDVSPAVSVQLQLNREQVRTTFEWSTGSKYCLLESMDCVTLTDSLLGLSRRLVRIKQIKENQDLTLSFIGEEVLVGGAAPPLYGQQAGSGFIPNYNLDPGLPQHPVFFEPPDELAGGLEVWMAVAGFDLTKWGGANVYLSYDDVNFAFAGQLHGASRMGVTTAPLAAITAATTPPTIDSSNVLSVDLSESKSQLLSGTLADMLGAATLCFVNGEFVAYQNAVSTGANAYNLSPLNRGLYGVAPKFSPAGSPFVRCDAGIFKIPFTQDRIGQTIYVKLVSYNQFGSGPQTIGSVSAFTYVIQGLALASPLPSVQSFTSVYQSGITMLSWKEISDFRSVLYEIRKGSSFDSGSTIGRFAHPPVPAIGDGTYWLNPVSTPLAGLTVYGATPISIALAGSVIPQNVKASWDEGATGWKGTVSGALFFDGTFIRTGATGDILGVADVFAITVTGTATISMTLASPGVIHWVGHGLVAGKSFALATTGTLLSPVVPLQTYFVKTVVDANNFTFSATNGGAAINTSGSQSGAHTIYVGGDILSFGPQGSGFYQIPTAHEVDVGYVAPCLVSITYSSAGVPVAQNIFDYDPIFTITDFFGAAANQFIDVHAEISTSQDAVTWGDFRDYQAGVYNARRFRARAPVISNDPQTIAFLTSFVFTVYVPTRVDNWALIGGTRTSLNNLVLLSSGANLTFMPDSQLTTAGFNGGVSNPTRPAIFVTIMNAQPGDIPVITNLTLAGCTVQVQNAGVGVARNVSIRPEGY